MKKVLFLFLLASLFAVSCSKPLRGGADDIITQQKHFEGLEDNAQVSARTPVTVPAAVLSTFNKLYTDAINIQWKKQSNGTFKAEFLRGSIKWEATFTAAGKLIKQQHN